MDSGPAALCVVIPFLNEEKSIPELLHRFAKLDGFPSSHELIFVSDGSTDGSRELVRAAAERDRRVKLIELSRNFGHQAAVAAGMDYAAGDAIAVMDADLQDEPEALLDMWNRLRSESCDVVFAVRSKRHGSLLKRAAYRAFYSIYGFLSETPVNMHSGDFCVMSRRCLDLLRQLPERHRFHRGLRAWVGLRQIEHPVVRPERFAGEPQYTWKGLFRLAIHGLTSFSVRPLRIASTLGLGLCALSILGAFAYIVCALTMNLPAIVPGFTSIVCLQLFLNGMLLVNMGIFGEYLGNVFLEVKGRPTYLVADCVNLPRPGTRKRQAVCSVDE